MKKGMIAIVLPSSWDTAVYTIPRGIFPTMRTYTGWTVDGGKWNQVPELSFIKMFGIQKYKNGIYSYDCDQLSC